MSLRQDRKAARASKKDKNGISLNLSRPVRRAMARLARRISGYNASPVGIQSGHQYTQPGATQHY